METLLIKPISINKCWQGRRYKTQDYKEWRDEAAMHLRGHPYAPEGEKLEVHIKFYLKSALSDIDNPIKPFLDALTESQRIKDDRYIMRLVVDKIKIKKDEEERIEYSIAGLEELITKL